MKEFYLLGRGELFLNFIGEANQLLRMPVTTTAESGMIYVFVVLSMFSLLSFFYLIIIINLIKDKRHCC